MRGFGPFGPATAALLATVLLASAGHCRAADKLRVGRPAAASSFVPLGAVEIMRSVLARKVFRLYD
jgi:hypothetical protein